MARLRSLSSIHNILTRVLILLYYFKNAALIQPRRRLGKENKSGQLKDPDGDTFENQRLAQEVLSILRQKGHWPGIDKAKLGPLSKLKRNRMYFETYVYLHRRVFSYDAKKWSDYHQSPKEAEVHLHEVSLPLNVICGVLVVRCSGGALRVDLHQSDFLIETMLRPVGNSLHHSMNCFIANLRLRAGGVVFSA